MITWSKTNWQYSPMLQKVFGFHTWTAEMWYHRSSLLYFNIGLSFLRPLSSTILVLERWISFSAILKLFLPFKSCLGYYLFLQIFISNNSMIITWIREITGHLLTMCYNQILITEIWRKNIHPVWKINERDPIYFGWYNYQVNLRSKTRYNYFQVIMKLPKSLIKIRKK